MSILVKKGKPMSEITKLYENAGIKPDINYICDIEPDGSRSCDRVEGYPEFTAEKVLKVIIFLLNKKVKLSFSTEESVKISVENFKECIAKSVNYLWQYLTEEEKQQVKGTLE